MKKVLIITNHRKDRSPGQRFRFEQYLSFLSSHGYDIEFSYLISEKEDKAFYNNGLWFKKTIIILKSFIKRFLDARKANSYDIIFIFREAFFTGTTYFEKKFSKSNAKIIFDFDDSIWLENVSDGNKKFNWLKNPSKTFQIIKLSDMVFVGNDYLKNYAVQFSSNVKVIPTTIDTDYHKPLKNTFKNNKICIGWTGTSTTLKYLEDILPVLKKAYLKYSESIFFKIIVDVEKYYPEIETQTTIWSLEKEIEDLHEIDIGIMPLPDNEWANGKCGFKGLQYMALEIPTLMSPVGVNKEIIEDGINGFLPFDDNDWVNKISMLIEDKELRKKIGVNARKTVEQKYSVNAWKNKYKEYFDELIKSIN